MQMGIATDPILLRSILGEMNEGVVAVDDSENIIYCNAAACRHLEFECHSPQVRLNDTPAGAEVFRVINDVRKDGMSFEREVKIDSPTSARFLRLQGRILLDRPGVPVFVVIHDISKMKRLEAIRRDFVANVSHELKTPLTSIRGYLETIEESVFEDKKRRTDFFGRVSQNVTRLTNLVNDLLALARIESEDVNLNHVDRNEQSCKKGA